MIELPLDIKIEIAKLDKNVWYKMYLYDDEFKKYSKSGLGIKVYKLTFIIKCNYIFKRGALKGSLCGKPTVYNYCCNCINRVESRQYMFKK